MMLAQQQASNQWAYYQAKVIREHLYRVQAEQVELALAERGAAMPPEVRQQAEARLKRYREEAGAATLTLNGFFLLVKLH